MFRQSLVRSSRSLSQSTRFFSLSARSMAEGDTGATKSGGAAQGDAFSKREKANEDMYVREQEMAKLRALRSKLQEQRKNIDELHKNIDEMLAEDKGSEKK